MYMEHEIAWLLELLFTGNSTVSHSQQKICKVPKNSLEVVL